MPVLQEQKPVIAGVEVTTPKTTDTYLDRAQSQTKGPVRVTAAVPSAKETKQLFGAPLYQRNVQPVWLEIEKESFFLQPH